MKVAWYLEVWSLDIFLNWSCVLISLSWVGCWVGLVFFAFYLLTTCINTDYCWYSPPQKEKKNYTLIEHSLPYPDLYSWSNLNMCLNTDFHLGRLKFASRLTTSGSPGIAKSVR